MIKENIRRKINVLYNEYLKTDYMILQLLKTIDEDFNLINKRETK